MKKLILLAIALAILLSSPAMAGKIRPADLNYSQDFGTLKNASFNPGMLQATATIFSDGTYIYAVSDNGTIIDSGTLNDDDSSIFQAAIDESSGEAALFVRRFDGEYLLETSIDARRGLLIYSDGAALNLTLLNGIAFKFNSTGNTLFSAYQGWTGMQGFKVKGYTADGNPNSNQWLMCAENTTRFLICRDITYGYMYNLIWLKGKQYSNQISNVVGYYSRGTLIRLDATGAAASANDAHNLRIVGVELSNKNDANYASSVGIEIDADADDGKATLRGVHVVDCWFERCDKCIINEGYDTVFRGNNLKSSNYGIIMPDASSTGYMPLIANNQFGYNVVADIANYRELNHISVTNNKFEAGNIALSNNCSNTFWAVNGNIFRANKIAINGSFEGEVVGNSFVGVNGITTYKALICSSLRGVLADNNFLWFTSNANTYTNYAATTPMVLNNKNLTSYKVGTSTGTGSQQTIAHGLAFTPTTVRILPTATGVTEASMTAASDATNIYLTVTSGKTYQWVAEYRN